MIKRENTLQQRWAWFALNGTVRVRTMSSTDLIPETWIDLVDSLVP